MDLTPPGDDADGEVDEEREATLPLGPRRDRPGPVAEPPRRPSGTLDVITQPIAAMPSRVAQSAAPPPASAPRPGDEAIGAAVLFDRAVEAMLKRDFDAALALLTRVRALEPDHHLARTNIERLMALRSGG